jgi:hypothetical protein
MGPRFVARKFLVAWPVDQSRVSFRCSARSSASLRCFQSPCMSRMGQNVIMRDMGRRWVRGRGDVMCHVTMPARRPPRRGQRHVEARAAIGRIERVTPSDDIFDADNLRSIGVGDRGAGRGPKARRDRESI